MSNKKVCQEFPMKCRANPFGEDIKQYLYFDHTSLMADQNTSDNLYNVTTNNTL